MALEVFTSARGALEVTRGTSLTPTRLLYAEEWTHEQDRQIIRSPEKRGSYFPVYSAASGRETNTITAAGRVSYTDLPWWLNLAVKAVPSGTAGGAGETTAFTHTFAPSSATDDVKSAYLELGYADTLATAPGISLPFVVCEELNLVFSKDDDAAIRFNASLRSPRAATQIAAFTGTLSDRTLRYASAINTQTYIDAATIGTTADNNVTSVDWTLTNGWADLWSLNNSAGAQATFRPVHRVWSATVTRYFANDVEWDAYLAATPRKVRVRTVGDIIAGATTSRYTIDLDLYGVYTARSIVDADGLKMEQLTLEPVYDGTAASDFRAVVINEVSATT